jgi:hypothetical protein
MPGLQLILARILLFVIRLAVRLGCLPVADRKFGASWPLAVGRWLPLGSQPQFPGDDLQGTCNPGWKTMRPRKLPKKPPSQPPIDVPTRIDSSLTSPPAGNPCRADAEHSFIVTLMKPVVYVLWYQVLPWTLSGDDLPLS